jgi:hypothetical protein
LVPGIGLRVSRQPHLSGFSLPLQHLPGDYPQRARLGFHSDVTLEDADAATLGVEVNAEHRLIGHSGLELGRQNEEAVAAGEVGVEGGGAFSKKEPGRALAIAQQAQLGQMEARAGSQTGEGVLFKLDFGHAVRSFHHRAVLQRQMGQTPTGAGAIGANDADVALDEAQAHDAHIAVRRETQGNPIEE